MISLMIKKSRSKVIGFFYIIRVLLKEGKQFMIWKLYLSIGFIFTAVTLWEILNIIWNTQNTFCNMGLLYSDRF